jgi:hypothetical protein
MAKVTANTVNLLDEMGYSINFCDKEENDTTIEKATKAVVMIVNDSGISFKTLNLPQRKELGVDWFLNKLETNKLYKNLSSTFAKILNLNGNTCVYPTSYGIGFTNYVFRDVETANKLKSILDQNGIEYKTEYSDAFYVYRFIISKKKENINKINSLIAK